MILENELIFPQDQRNRQSLLENEVRTADDQKTLEFGKHQTRCFLEDHNRNSNMNDRPAEGI